MLIPNQPWPTIAASPTYEYFYLRLLLVWAPRCAHAKEPAEELRIRSLDPAAALRAQRCEVSRSRVLRREESEYEVSE